MPELLGKIEQDFLAAYKAKEQGVISTLRMLKSALKNKKIDVQHELDDKEVEAVIRSQIKQLQESAQMAREGNRPELAEASETEVALLERYLPAQLGDEELKGIVAAALAEAGATSKADFGKAMGRVMKAVAGRADGTRVRAMVESLLPVLALAVAGLLMHAHPVLAQYGTVAQPPAWFTVTGYAELLLRLGRVVLMMFGLIFVNLILRGSFGFMLAGGRDDDYGQARQAIVSGFLGTIFVAALFVVLTIQIGKFS